MITRELYLNKIRPFINKDIVKVITGIRRSGKSIMLLIIQQELSRQGISPSQILHLNFEDMANARLCDAQNLNQWVTERAKEITGKVYLFLDEIQEVREWERVVNSLRVSVDINIYITGSNAKLLSGELATYLAGRYVQFTIYPFSYQEFLLQTVQKIMQKCSSNIFYKEGCPFSSTCLISQMLQGDICMTFTTRLC